MDSPITMAAVPTPPHLVIFTDASSITLAAATAQTGYLIFLAHECGSRGALAADTPLVLLVSGSHRQRHVTQSFFAAEAYALLDGMRAAIEVACMLGQTTNGLGVDVRPIDAVTDCLTLFNALSATVLVKPKEMNAGVEAPREL